MQSARCEKESLLSALSTLATSSAVSHYFRACIKDPLRGVCRLLGMKIKESQSAYNTIETLAPLLARIMTGIGSAGDILSCLYGSSFVRCQKVPMVKNI
jgi:hypothetical protein